jgi:hypothetical protein
MAPFMAVEDLEALWGAKAAAEAARVAKRKVFMVTIIVIKDDTLGGIFRFVYRRPV